MSSASRSSETPRRPAPLLAAAAALVGVAAARSPLGKLALLAAAGTAAYRYLNRPSEAPRARPLRTQTEADWCQIRSAPQPIAQHVFEPVNDRLVQVEEPVSDIPESVELAVQAAITQAFTDSEQVSVEEAEPETLTADLELQEASVEDVIEEPAVEVVEEVAAIEESAAKCEPFTLPVPEVVPTAVSPLWLADPLPHLPALPVQPTAISSSHPLASSAENPWLLSVEPLPVLLTEEPARLNDALLESGLLDPAAETISAPVTTSPAEYVPPIAVGGDIPDVIDINIEPEPEPVMEAPIRPKTGPMTSERMAELLRALGAAATEEVVEQTPPAMAGPGLVAESLAETPRTFTVLPEPRIAPASAPSVVEPEPAAFASAPEVSEPEAEAPRPFTVLPEPRIAPAEAVATAEEITEEATDPTPSVPLVSAAALFASLAVAEGRDQNVDEAEEEDLTQVVPKSPVTTSLRPKLRPRPIVTVAHPNHPGRKNWLTWWK